MAVLAAKLKAPQTSTENLSFPATEDRHGTVLNDKPVTKRQALLSTYFDLAQMGISLLPGNERRVFYRLGVGFAVRPIPYTKIGGVAFTLHGRTNFSSGHTLHGGANGEFNVGTSGMARLFAGVGAGIQYDDSSAGHQVRPSVQGEFGATFNLTRLFRASPFIALQGVIPGSKDSNFNTAGLKLFFGLRLEFHFLRTGEPTPKKL